MTDMTGRGRSQATRGKGNRRANISQRLIPDSPMPVTPPSTLPAPHSCSPVPNTLSPTPVESQTLVAPTEAISGTSTSMFLTLCHGFRQIFCVLTFYVHYFFYTDDDTSTQKRGPRGEYLNRNIPKDPSEKKLIHIIGPSE